MSPLTKEQARNRQRIARAIERSFPRDLTDFIDFIAKDYGASNRYQLQSRALQYARLHYNASAGEPA